MVPWLVGGGIVLGALYVGLLVAFRVGLSRLRVGRGKELPAVTVVVAARNEAARIDGCLAALAAQDYPADRTEIIVVDDRSDDDTAERARRWARRIPGLWVLRVETPQYRCPKKSALGLGIRTGRGEILLTTDADCRPPPGWIASAVRSFEPGVGMVAGYAPLIPGGGLLSGLLALQGTAVAALAAGSAGLGFPLAASGRNLAYRRQAFEEVGGFASIGHIRGGDDVLLMRRIAAHTNWTVRYNPDPDAGVPSPTHSDHLFDRQVRYQSKALHMGIRPLILALSVYIFHLWMVAGAFLAWIFPDFRLPFFGVVAAKVAADGLFLGKAAGRFGVRRSLVWFPLLELLSVPYTVLFPALGALRPFRWK